MTSINFSVGETVYVPFWSLLDFLDATPPEPFVKCKILNLVTQRQNSPNGPVEYMAADLDLGKPDLFANGVPIEYLIKAGQLQAWADKIADWFRGYPATQVSQS